MMHRITRTVRCLPVVALLGVAACGGNPARVELDVDLYLHPDSASPNDVLLQTAILKRIRENIALQSEAIHVRSFEDVVFLSGSVRDPCSSNTAGEIARTTSVAVEGSPDPIRAGRVENNIEIPDGESCAR